jgi:hypothetical protein
MPHQGESASFFSLYFDCNIQAGLPLPPPFLPPLSPVPSPTATPGELGQRSFHAGAQTFYFQRKPVSEGDCPRAGATQESGRATGSAPAPVRVELAGRTEAPGAALGPSIAECSRPAGEDQEALWYPRPGDGRRDQLPPLLCPAGGPANAQRAGAARERRGSRIAAPLPSRPQALCGFRL